MHDHVTVVQQDPPRVGLALSVQRLAADLFDELVAQVFHNGAGLTFAASRGNDEVISNQRYASNIEQDDIAGKFVGGEVDNTSSQAQRLGTVRRRRWRLSRPTLQLRRSLVRVVSGFSSCEMSRRLSCQVVSQLLRIRRL